MGNTGPRLENLQVPFLCLRNGQVSGPMQALGFRLEGCYQGKFCPSFFSACVTSKLAFCYAIVQ